MRKTAVLLVLTILIQCFAVTGAFAATNVVEKSVEGSISKITYTQASGSAGTLSVYASGAAIANRELWSPDATHTYYRLIVDIKNTKIGTPGTLTVNKGSVLQVRYSQFDAIRSRIVIDIKDKPTYTVSALDSRVDIQLNGAASPADSPAASVKPTPKPSAAPTPKPSANPTPTPKPAAVPTPTPKASVAPSATPKPAAVAPSTPIPAANATATPPANNTASAGSATRGPLSWDMTGDTCVFKLDNTDIPALVAQGVAAVENRIREKTLQITFNGIDPRFTTGAMAGNNILYGTLVSTNTMRQTTTIRISGKTSLGYTMEKSGTGTLLRIKSSGTAVAGTGGTTTGSGSQTGSTTGTATGSNATTGSTTGTGVIKNPTTVGDTSVSRGLTSNLPVQFSATADTVLITSSDVSGSRVYRLGKNLVIELPGIAQPSVVTVGSPLVRDVTGYSSDGRVKLIVTTGVFADWVVMETAGRLAIKLSPADIANLEGGNDGDVVLRLTGDGIAARYRAAMDASQVIVDDDFKMSAFTFMFPMSVVNLGNGVAKTNDALTTGISTLTTGQSSFLSIAKRDGATQFRMVEEADGNALTIRKSVAEAPVSVPSGVNRLVVLDAGHGGTDPGTVFEGLYESTVNLDITLRVEAILKLKNINVSLTRRGDAFVGLDERCNLANNTAASLFVSIHQNSMPDPATKGTMTMYYASSVNGKRYADIMQQTLAPAVGLGSIGLKSNSGLVVLRKTKMPAILAEVGCMSNVSDLQIIKTDAYRQNAAQGIADGIVKILATMN